MRAGEGRSGGTFARRFFVGTVVLAVAFALDDTSYYQVLRAVILYEHSGEVREALMAAKALASGLGTLAVAAVIAFLDRRRRRRALVFLLAVAAATAAGSALKGLTGRERPSHLDQAPGEERVWEFHGPRIGMRLAPFQSFPSGHTASAFAAATCLSAFYPQAGVVFYLTAGASGLNRLVKHQHFPSDVVAGALVGHLVAFWLLRRRRLRRWWEPEEVDSRTGHP